MKHDVQVESLKKLQKILDHWGIEPDSILYHDIRDLISHVIQDAYKAGAEFYKETSGIKIGLEKMSKSRQFKGKFANLKELDKKRTQGRWYRSHASIYKGVSCCHMDSQEMGRPHYTPEKLIATCQNPGFEFADSRFLMALVDIWPMIQGVLNEK